MKFKTTAAYLSGAICGKLWMPSAMAGKPIQKQLRGAWGFFDKGDTFKEALNSLLMKEGGDFQNAQFSADTVIRVERKTAGSAGRYEVHVREIEIAKLCDCGHLVNQEAFAGDFFNE